MNENPVSCWIRNLGYWKSDNRIGFSNLRIIIMYDFIELFSCFSNIGPPYWIRHFEFWKFYGRFGFSDPKNRCTDNFIEFWTFLKILTAILDPPFWILKFWWLIWIQRPQKSVYGQFHRVPNIFKNFDRHIGSATLNFENLMLDLDSTTPKTSVRTILSSSEHFSKFWPPYWIRLFEFWKFYGRFGFSDPENLCTDNFIEFRTFFKILIAILDPPFWILKIWHLSLIFVGK